MRVKRIDTGPAAPAHLFWHDPTAGQAVNAWNRIRRIWHAEHAVDGVSHLGDELDLICAARLARLAHDGVPGQVPIPVPWRARWHERPESMRGKLSMRDRGEPRAGPGPGASIPAGPRGFSMMKGGRYGQL